ncbi:hypothetical protein F8388_005316 [Cannabis sativa]|uniref:Uncharacterized protein n=1 Tax=Cannabis sativa TaxID=3483 RepID=A0A7J6EL82_CANSA|nr:hypothetical protein F8388_005316 [Cannabis sativa]
MKGMTLCPNNASILQNQLYTSLIRQHNNLSPSTQHQVTWWFTSGRIRLNKTHIVNPRQYLSIVCTPLALEQEDSPNPTVKKNFRLIFFGTLAGNFALARLRIFWLNLKENDVSFSLGFKRGSFLFFLWFGPVSYSSRPMVVELSKAAGPVTYGLAAMAKMAFGAFGFTYTASASTTVRLWLAILKNSSSLSAALIKRNQFLIEFESDIHSHPIQSNPIVQIFEPNKKGLGGAET